MRKLLVCRRCQCPCGSGSDLGSWFEVRGLDNMFEDMGLMVQQFRVWGQRLCGGGCRHEVH